MQENSVNSVKNDSANAISFSDKALTHIKKEMAKQGDGCLGIRFSVSKTGCSGLSYVVDYVFAADKTDKHFVIESWLNVYINHKAYPFLKGLSVDYVLDGLNQKFSFTNPNQTGACGCGESFTIDERFLDD